MKPVDPSAPATPPAQVAGPPAPRPSIDRRMTTAALLITMVLVSMEMTIASTAMPTIIGELQGLAHYAWVASVYLLTATVTMPLYGRLADVLGRKRVLLTAISLFCLGSLLCSTAQSMPQLIIWRGLQGLGAGGVMPIVLTILGDLFTLEERARIQGYFTAVWGTSALAGPALGAFLVNTLGWRSIFFVNIPFGAVAIAILIWRYHDVEKPHHTSLDLPGAASLATACTCLLLLVSRLGPDGWSVAMIACLLGVATLAAVFFIYHERRTPHPLVSPQMLAHRGIGPAMLAALLLGAGFLSLDTFVPLYIQGARGGGPTAAAAVVTPVMLASSLFTLVAMPLIVRWGFRKTALLGCILFSAGFAALLLAAALNAPQWGITAVLLIAGAGMTPASMSYLLSAQNAVDWQQRGGVTASVTFCRTMGGALGVGILGALFNLLTRKPFAELADQGVAAAAALDPSRHSELPEAALEQVHGIIGHAMLWLFGAMLLLALLQTLATLRLPRAPRPDHKPTSEDVIESISA